MYGGDAWKKGWMKDQSFPRTLSDTADSLYLRSSDFAFHEEDLLKAILPSELLARIPVRAVGSYIKKDRVDIEHAGEFNDLLVEQMKSLATSIKLRILQ